MKRLKDLSLRAKVTLTLTAVFAAIVGVFLLVLLPFQEEQRAQLLDQNKRLVETLRDNYQRSFIVDILSENQDSLMINLASLARQPGILAIRVESETLDLAATGDQRVMQSLLDPQSPLLRSADPAPVLLLHEDGTARLLGSEAGALDAAVDVNAGELPPWRQDAVLVGAFEETVWNGEQVLYSVAEMKAADDVYGRLHILSSLATVMSSEALTRTIFYGLVGSAFILLLVLLNVLLSRIVIAPLTRVVEAMGRASKGQLDLRLPVHSRDEIGTMAGSFNRMVEKLASSKEEIEDYSRNLEAKVAARTSELQASEENLRNTRNYLATLIANVATGVISLDEEGRINTFNSRAAEILSVANHEATQGRGLEEVLSLDGRSKDGRSMDDWSSERARLCEFISSVRKGKSRQKKGQLSLKRPEGRQVLSVIASRLEGENGKKQGTVVVFDDLTQILASQRLKSWKQAVERVIHEIKNPLTPVGLAAETLRIVYDEDRDRFNEIFPSASKMILNSLQDLKNLISEFSRFSRLPKTLMGVHDLNNLVKNALAPYEHGAMEGITVTCDLAAGLPEIEADADQLKRVLLNVVNNALEAMHGKGGELTVKTGLPDESGYLTITITDQGPGVDDVAKIFEPHFTTKVKGTGLGLAIARQIVEEHGGEIRVRSELGRGTTVEIALPQSTQASAIRWVE